VPAKPPRRALAFVAFGLVAAVAVIVLSFPKYTPDLTYTVPTAATLLVMLGASCAVLAQKAPVAKIWLAAWLSLSVARIVYVGFWT
jgi:hypothetical protein